MQEALLWLFVIGSKCQDCSPTRNDLFFIIVSRYFSAQLSGKGSFVHFAISIL